MNNDIRVPLLWVLVIAGTLLLLSVAHAAEERGHGNHDADHSSDHSGDHGDMSHESNNMFLVKKAIDGYTVSFHVMEAQVGMRHGGSHNFMIKVEQNDKALDNVIINSKVIYPNNKADSKSLMKMGEWYMAGYDLGQKGEHQLMILFKTVDGQKHQGGVYYPQRK